MEYIYKITNKINNKIYIGLITQTIQEQWRQHIASAYGKKNKNYNKVIKKAAQITKTSIFKVSAVCNNYRKTANSYISSLIEKLRRAE